MKFSSSKVFKNSLVKISVFILLLAGCGKSHNQSVNENSDFQRASWITDSRVWPVKDSLMYGDFPAPVFRKEFKIKKELKSATLYITAAGYYSATINGKQISQNYLDPAWTNFSKRIYYSEFDLTREIISGTNCLGATLGNGFYNPLPMKMWSTFNLRDGLTVGKPVFIARLKLEYTDGEKEEVNTDRSWKFSYGPIIKNNVYLGEVYNGGKEIEGWNLAGFDDSKWKESIQNKGPGGNLEKAFFPPIQVSGKHNPVAVIAPEKGIYILDMGVNFTGLYKIRLKGQKGDTITFRFGERLYDDSTLNPMTSVAGQIKRIRIKSKVSHEATWNSGVFNTNNGPGCPDVAWQTDSYIFGDKSDIWYTPTFTFHIFRYMEIKGLKNKPEIADAEGIAFNTNVSDSNNFSCSSDLINKIQVAARRTFTNNLISVQSDCPGRERFGYGGDLNATCESFIYNFNMHSFYRKTVYDWVDSMKDSVFIDLVPYVGIKGCGLSWESGFLITQYKLLLYYNDIELIKELYNLDLKWMDKVARIHPSGIVDKGLSDHESLVKVPVKLIGTTHYLECARIMTKFATIMNDKENEQKFDKLATKLSNSVLDMYWKQPVTDTINKQTLFSTLLYHNIVPGNEIKAATDSLLKAVKEGPAGHFTTGIFGTQYILESLSETGNTGSVFNIVNSTSFPGWGYMISKGATTIWETWKESDNVYSNCHPMFGSVAAWFYSRLAGIRPDPENPGFKKFIINPFLPSDLTYVNCTYRSPFGLIKSNWKKSKEGKTFEITVPKSSSATFSIPIVNKSTITIEDLTTKQVISKNVAAPVFEQVLTEGNYKINLK
jgi:alpha-L-rhamnosidase